ncbi:MAG: nuclear transport factor 2 family protein [Defluviitaleaceae bacterium]|nr:nuclear transport factor 2 family protein [Defluviitaleaceae bacterium]
MSDFESALNLHLKAISDRDFESFKNFLCPEHNCIVILPNGHKIEGYNEVLDFHKDWFADSDWSIECKILDAFSISDAGYALLDVVYQDIDADNMPYKLAYYLSMIFTKAGGKWILLRDQNTLRE